jgi:UDP-2,3-diacylglucosamine pyrophosphatase LpxH
VKLIYVPGNHDRPARRFCGLVLPTMQVRRRAIHRCADGRRLLVTHGDEFDATTRLGGVQEWLGEQLYVGILAGNRMINRIRLRLGMRYWSLSEFLKRQSRAAEHYIQRYAQAGLASARQRGLDGIVCGHIHRPALADVDGMVYANDGDWVENLSALAEHTDGTLSLLHWNNEVRVVHSLPRSAAADLRIAA